MINRTFPSFSSSSLPFSPFVFVSQERSHVETTEKRMKDEMKKNEAFTSNPDGLSQAKPQSNFLRSDRQKERSRDKETAREHERERETLPLLWTHRSRDEMLQWILLE